MKHLLMPTVLAAVTAGFPLAVAAQQPADRMKDKPMAGEMAMPLAKGTFAGADKHLAAGSYEIITVDGKYVLRTSADFSADPGAPDIYVVLAPTPKVGKKDGVWLGKLASHTGAQSFTIPVDAKLDGLNLVVLWCKKYGVAVGTAAFDQAGLKTGMMDKPKPTMMDKPKPTS
jgi:hypothetical protein